MHTSCEGAGSRFWQTTEISSLLQPNIHLLRYMLSRCQVFKMFKAPKLASVKNFHLSGSAMFLT